MEAFVDSYISRNGEIVDECAALRAEIARLESRVAALLSERVSRLLAEVPPGSTGFEAAERSMLCEVAAGLHLTKATAARELGASWMLHDRFPSTRAALAEGTISLRHATAITESAASIPTKDAAALSDYERQVVPFAAAETVARTVAFAKSVSAALAPENTAERHRRAHADRRVVVTDLEDGMAHLSAILPSVLAHAVHDRLTAMGRRLRDEARAESRSREEVDPDALAPTSRNRDDSDSDSRTLDEIRADVLADLLLTTDPTSAHGTALESIQATVQVTVAATTLTGDDQRMAEHDGHGPLLPGTARPLAGTSSMWTRLFLDAQGMVIRTDSYAPTSAMRRFLRARDRHCRFPGCRRAARRCEIDHNHDHAKGGHTEIGNLCCLCPTHHTLKHPDHDARWRWRAIQRLGGVIDWISPTGQVYTDAVPPRVQFVPLG